MGTYSKGAVFEKALEIVKAYASSGGATPLHVVLRSLYEEMMKINAEPDKTE